MFPSSNYFEAQHYDPFTDPQRNQTSTITDRNAVVRLLFKFQLLGKFKTETFFTSVAILDRYLSLKKPENFQSYHMNLLAVVCFTLGGKIEEQEQLCFENVTQFYKHKTNIDRALLLTIQKDVLVRFGFDFNMPSI